MTDESLLNRDWQSLVDRLGGAETLKLGARETKAFPRARAIDSAVDLLRMILAYCLGQKCLRLAAAWASAIGLVDISNVALLYRLRRCGDWLGLLIGQALACAAPKASRGRLVRVIDATTVPKAGTAAKRGNKLWRIHSAFDLLAAFRKAAARGLIDRPIWLGRKCGPALGLRLVAVKKPAQAAEAARCKAHLGARKERSSPRNGWSS